MNQAGSLETAFASESWTLLADNARASTWPTLLVGALLAGYYTVFAGLPRLWAWWLVLAAALVVRALALHGASRARPAFWLGMLAVGVSWGGVVPLVAWPGASAEPFTAMLFAAGIAVAAFASYALDWRVAACITVPIGLAITAQAVAIATAQSYAVVAALPLLYAHQFMVGRRSRQVLERQLHLRVANAALVEQLSARAEKTTAELDRRLETERVLRASRDRAERLSATDGLTEIANRRYFDKRLKSEVSRAFRDRTSLSLVVADIDYFKQFNDLYGHQQGDACLKVFARVLEGYCRRGGDLAARLGGEEFALLLPATDHEAALRLAEQARQTFEAQAILHAGSKVHDNATASFGVASVVPDGLEAGGVLYRAADQALYLAKERGRNRVVGASEIADAALAAS